MNTNEKEKMKMCILLLLIIILRVLHSTEFMNLISPAMVNNNGSIQCLVKTINWEKRSSNNANFERMPHATCH